MKKINLFILVAITFFTCKKDFIVEDIKNKTIIINAPANNLVTTANKVTFWWELLDGAEKYNIQVVKPNFSSITEIIADTTLTGSKYNLNLQPGTYQWRIRAMNAGGNTVYQTFSLKVDTTSNLSSLTVSTIDPVANLLTSAKRIAFSWIALNAATQYQVLILNSSSGVVKDTTTSLTTYTYTFPSQGAYSWKVRASNDFSISQYNSALTFTIDLTAPAAPVLSSPSHNAIITPTNNLVWNRVGAPDARYDSVYIATDSSFTNVISKTKTYLQSISVASLTNPPPATSTIYWWRLRSVDSVGNRSVYSSQLKFKLNP
jgi:predicted phage tail protein